MKRAEKIALLTKVLQEGTNPVNRQSLQQFRANSPRSLIIIDDLELESGQSMSDIDPVHFYDNGKQHQMTLAEAYQYGNRYGVRTLFIIPTNHRC